MPAELSITAINASAYLQREIFGKFVPPSEYFNRIYTGRNIDLNRIEQAIRQADVGLMTALTDLGRESRDVDPAFAGIVNKRIDTVAFAEVSFTPPKTDSPKEAGEAKRFATIVEQHIRKIRKLRSAMKRSQYAIFDGRSALEVQWEYRTTGPVTWAPVELGWIHPARLCFDEKRRIRVVERHTQTGYFKPVGPCLEELPGKFIARKASLFCDYPEREGLAPRSLYWLFFKRFSWRHRLILTELFGIPWRIVETDKEAPTAGDVVDDAEQAARKLGAETTAALNPGQTLNVVQADPKSIEFFSMTSKEVDEQLAKLVLGQNATSQADGNRAETVVLKSEQELIVQGDAVDFDDEWQEQLIDTFMALNFGADSVPLGPRVVKQCAPTRDRKSELDRVKTVVVDFGMGVAKTDVYEMAGIRQPEEDEELVQPPAPPGMAPGAGGVSGVGVGPKGGQFYYDEDGVKQYGTPPDAATKAVENMVEGIETAEKDAGLAARREPVQTSAPEERGGRLYPLW